jgi:hypothetical protein
MKNSALNDSVSLDAPFILNDDGNFHSLGDYIPDKVATTITKTGPYPFNSSHIFEQVCHDNEGKVLSIESPIYIELQNLLKIKETEKSKLKKNCTQNEYKQLKQEIENIKNQLNNVSAPSPIDINLNFSSEFYIETKSKKSRLNVDILQHQADSIRAELNSAITGVATASDKVYNLNPALNVKRTPSTRRQVDVQANTAILTQLVAQLELSKVSLRKETPLVQLIDRPILPLEKDKVGRLKSLVLGGFLAGFLTVLYLVFGQLYRKMVA